VTNDAHLNPIVIFDWTTMIDAAVNSLPTLQRDILKRTLALPGQRRRVFYTEALQNWNLDRDEFDRQREAAFESVRLYLKHHGITGIDDLALR
jgi:hypothetical protein